MSVRRGFPPDIVPAGMTEDGLRALYGSDADQVIAFRRFLKLPLDGEGRKLCPPHWLAWAQGNMDAAEVLRLDGA